MERSLHWKQRYVFFLMRLRSTLSVDIPDSLKHEWVLPVSERTWATALRNSLMTLSLMSQRPLRWAPRLQWTGSASPQQSAHCATQCGLLMNPRNLEILRGGAGWSQVQPVFSELQINSRSAGLVPKQRPSLVPWAVGDKMPGLKVGREAGISEMCFIWCGHCSAESCLFRPL